MRIGHLYLVAFAITACSTSPHVCTLKGCAPGLLVQISGIANVTAVEAESSGGGVYRHECPGAACGENLWVLFQDFFPRDVRIRVIAGGDTTTRDFQPVYRDEFINGPGCDPPCRRGTVTVTP